MNEAREGVSRGRRFAGPAIAASALLVLAFLAGCEPGLARRDARFAMARASAAVAFAEAEIARENLSRPTTCDECGGTGTVPSGDGLARVPCECVPNCACAENAPSLPGESQNAVAPSRRRRLLYFTAAWCPTCRANEPTLAALAARGWKIGTADSNQIQIVDLDVSPELARHFGFEVVPAWVLIDDGVAVRRRLGVLDPFAVGRLFEK